MNVAYLVYKHFIHISKFKITFRLIDYFTRYTTMHFEELKLRYKLLLIKERIETLVKI